MRIVALRAAINPPNPAHFTSDDGKNAVVAFRALQALGKSTLGVSSFGDTRHASPVSAQLAAGNRFLASTKRRGSALPENPRGIPNTCLTFTLMQK
jgi:hypothetical protein